jgi:hypothetical protein
MKGRAKTFALITLCVSVVVLLILQRTRITKLYQQNAELRAQLAEVQRKPAAEQPKPATATSPDPELLRLRAEVAELRRQRVDLARTGASSRVQQVTTTAGPGELPLDIWRRNNTQVLKSLVLALHLTISDRRPGKPGEKLEIANTNGDLTPELRREIEKLLNRDGESRDANLDAAWRDIELLITDAAEFGKLDPVTIIARTIPRKTEDGKWMRVYAIADGSAHVRVHNTPDEVWQAPAP